MTEEGGDDWENLLDSGELDQKLDQIKIDESKGSKTAADPFDDEECSQSKTGTNLGDPTFSGPVRILTNDSRLLLRKQEPTMKILKRPEQNPVKQPEPQSQKAAPKSLSQREAEYAEARQRILGSEVTAAAAAAVSSSSTSASSTTVSTNCSASTSTAATTTTLATPSSSTAVANSKSSSSGNYQSSKQNNSNSNGGSGAGKQQHVGSNRSGTISNNNNSRKGSKQYHQQIPPPHITNLPPQGGGLYRLNGHHYPPPPLPGQYPHHRHAGPPPLYSGHYPAAHNHQQQLPMSNGHFQQHGRPPPQLSRGGAADNSFRPHYQVRR
eukprot:TRINITY_DN2210_c0_g1_i8.p1 TRINITY_DN2210_c0_g1~~TRINITY_DN2210_c0_g1_i8.p1  ORF type:complete len:324 (+),score=80.14 TRINITY_DN2210_c0_g1_i8:25-996(+)